MSKELLSHPKQNAADIKRGNDDIRKDPTNELADLPLNEAGLRLTSVAYKDLYSITSYQTIAALLFSYAFYGPSFRVPLLCPN